MPSSGPSCRALLGLLTAGLLVGCPAPDGSDGPGDDDSTGSDTGDIGDPAFLNPVPGEFLVLSTEYVPRDIVVGDIAVGNTQLVVDGQNAGTLGPGSALGELTGDRLRLFLHGALTLGAHTLQLASTGADGPRFSGTLTMMVQAPLRSVPRLSVALEPEPRDRGDALFLGGGGPHALLGVLAAGPTPTLRLYRRDGEQWGAAPIAEAALPGHVFAANHMSLGTDIAALALPPIVGSDVTTVRIAYRRGLPGDAILTRDLTISPEPVIGPLETAVDLSASFFADAEFAALGRPFLLGHAVVGEFLAVADSEIPHPGDRGLAHALRLGGGWSAPERVPTPGPLDLDAGGQVLSLPTLGAGLSVRVGQHQAGLLHLSDAGAALLSLVGQDTAFPPGDPAVITTIASSFGAHTVAAVTRDHLALNFLGVSGDVQNRDASVPAGTLPAATVTGPPAPGVVLGYSAFLLPYGDAAPVHAVLSDGGDVYVVALTAPEPLHCRHIALMPGLGGNDDAEPALTLACIDGEGALRIGVLRAEPIAP